MQVLVQSICMLQDRVLRLPPLLGHHERWTLRLVLQQIHVRRGRLPVQGMLAMLAHRTGEQMRRLVLYLHVR